MPDIKSRGKVRRVVPVAGNRQTREVQGPVIAVQHELHDWDFKMSFKMEPRLVTEDGKKSYDFSPYITISILWRPMSAMKTEIIDDYGEWKLQ